MNLQYTPWRWQNLGGALMLVTDGGGARVVLAGDHDTILTRDSETGTLRPMQSTDAPCALIEAAPDLLRALREITEALERAGWADDPEDLETYDREIGMAKAAIAKAEGRA